MRKKVTKILCPECKHFAPLRKDGRIDGHTETIRTGFFELTRTCRASFTLAVLKTKLGV